MSEGEINLWALSKKKKNGEGEGKVNETLFNILIYLESDFDCIIICCYRLIKSCCTN